MNTYWQIKVQERVTPVYDIVCQNLKLGAFRSVLEEIGGKSDTFNWANCTIVSP